MEVYLKGFLLLYFNAKTDFIPKFIYCKLFVAKG